MVFLQKIKKITQWYITSVYYTFPRLDYIPPLTLLMIIGFHRASATGVACRQGTLTPPDTLSSPTFGLACVLMSRSISPELVSFPDFLSFEHPSVLLFFLCTSDKAGFSPTRNMTRINVGLTLSLVKRLLSSWKIYVQFDGKLYKQITGIPMGTNCSPLTADLFHIDTRGILCQTSRNPNG